MYSNGVNSGYGSSMNGTEKGEGNAKGADFDSALGKDAFLRLLTTQLRYQDPMNPVDDQQFLAQMAQFSALEQMQNLTSTMERFVAAQESSNLLASATSLLGREVEVIGPSGESYSGKVDAIRMVDGVPRLLVGDTMFQVRDVVRIVESAAGSDG